MRRLLVFLAAGSLLISCSRDLKEDDDNNNNNGKEGEDLVADESEEPGLDTVPGEEGTSGPETGKDQKETIGPSGTKIADLQQKQEGLNCEAGTDFINMDQGVELKGVLVTTPVYASSTKLDGFFVEDPAGGQFSGIKVVLDKGTAPALAVGDVVTMTGDLKEYYCVTELDIVSATVTSAGLAPGPDLVTPEAIAADNPQAEPWEGVLVRLENVTVESTDSYGMTLAGGARVEDDIFPGMQPADTGCKYLSVTGVVDFAFGKYRILPRTEADLVLDESQECEGPQPAETIKSIQESETSVVCTEEAFVNAGAVSLTGVVVASPRYVVSKDKLHGFFVSDGVGGPNSGILVTTDLAQDVQYEIGDILDLAGGWTEYYCMTEVKAESHESTGKLNGPVPVTDVTGADLTGNAAEPFEGVLVRLSDVTVTEEINKYGEFFVTGGIMISTKFIPGTTVKLGDKFAEIVGPVEFSFDNYKIMPWEL